MNVNHVVNNKTLLTCILDMHTRWRRGSIGVMGHQCTGVPDPKIAPNDPFVKFVILLSNYLSRHHHIWANKYTHKKCDNIKFYLHFCDSFIGISRHFYTWYFIFNYIFIQVLMCCTDNSHPSCFVFTCPFSADFKQKTFGHFLQEYSSGSLCTMYLLLFNKVFLAGNQL